MTADPMRSIRRAHDRAVGELASPKTHPDAIESNRLYSHAVNNAACEPFHGDVTKFVCVHGFAYALRCTKYGCKRCGVR